MDPQVRYCTTSDGVRIAYTVTGSGPPIVLSLPGMASHVQLEWSQPLFRRLFERVIERHTLIRLDPRCAGMSDRLVPTTSQCTRLDIEAVADRLQLAEFSLVAVAMASHVIPYVAHHPQQVRRLVLIDAYLEDTAMFSTSQGQAVAKAVTADFDLATELIGVAAFGPGRAESASYGVFVRECIGPEYFAHLAATAADATAEASAIHTPTLVIRHDGLQYVKPEMTRQVVASLPNARLVVLPGMWADEPERLADRCIAFVNDEEYVERSGPSTTHRPAGLLIVLFTELVGHTEMMQRLGDERGRAVLREHERITREVLAAHSGLEIKTMGDGFMASFTHVTKAVECAIALQRAFEAWNERAGHAGAPLRVRVGLNAGEPIAEDGDLFGSTVILAARLAAQAGAGEILIPDGVRHLLSGKDFLFSDRGNSVLKGFEDPVRLWEVRWRQ